MTKNIGFPGIILSAGLLLYAGPVQAQTANDSFSVTATVLEICSVTANDLAFGNYDPTSATNLDGTATMDVACTIGTSYEVGLNQGTAVGATVSTRSMTSGGNSLDYDLYQDSGRTTNWGNTPGVDTPSAAIAGASADTLTVYGRIPALQNVAAGSYSDTITVTVTY